MGYTLKMRIWRGDQDGGDLGDYEVEELEKYFTPEELANHSARRA